MCTRRFSIFLLLLALAGCNPVRELPEAVLSGAASAATQTPSAISLDERFSLAFGASAALQDGGLLLTFSGITEDSRCPSDVDCDQAGSVAVELRAELAGEQPQVVQLGGQTDYQGNVTWSVPGAAVQPTAEVGGYTLELLAVTPYPTAAEAPEVKDYRIALVVLQAPS